MHFINLWAPLMYFWQWKGKKYFPSKFLNFLVDKFYDAKMFSDCCSLSKNNPKRSFVPIFQLRWFLQRRILKNSFSRRFEIYLLNRPYKSFSKYILLWYQHRILLYQYSIDCPKGSWVPIRTLL